MHTIGKIFKFIILTTLIVFIVVWLSTLLKCEILTSMYGEEFYFTSEEDTYTFGEIDYLKVLDYNENYARVYYLSNGKKLGLLFNFTKYEGGWAHSLGHAVWSKTGSASDVIFPYWWHFIYGGL